MLYGTRRTVGSAVIAGLVVVVVVSVGVGAVASLSGAFRREKDTFGNANVSKVIVVLDDGEAIVVVTLQ